MSSARVATSLIEEKMHSFRLTATALLLLGTVGSAAAQYYYPPPPGYPGGYRRYGPPTIQCPPPLVPDTDRYGRQYCREWYPARGSECPPGYTVQSGRCKPYRGY
jgi:hypothetical protein